MAASEKDLRGFSVYADFEDVHGCRVVVKESSSAEEYRVRIYHYDEDHALELKVPPGAKNYPCLHLNVEQAALLHEALGAFIDDE